MIFLQNEIKNALRITSQGEKIPRYHLNSRFRALISRNGADRSSLLHFSERQLRGDRHIHTTQPFTGRLLSWEVLEVKLPFYAFNMDKLSYILNNVNRIFP